MRLQFPLLEGADVYPVVLQLNTRSLWGLQGYAAKRGIPLNHALRLISRAAVESARTMGAGRTMTLENAKVLFRAVQPKPEMPTVIRGPYRFRNVRRETTRARMRKWVRRVIVLRCWSRAGWR